MHPAARSCTWRISPSIYLVSHSILYSTILLLKILQNFIFDPTASYSYLIYERVSAKCPVSIVSSRVRSCATRVYLLFQNIRIFSIPLRNFNYISGYICKVDRYKGSYVCRMVPTWLDCSGLLYSTAWMHFGGHC